jgi:hypothetical protein
VTAASLLSKLCNTHERRRGVIGMGGLEAVSTLTRSTVPKLHEAGNFPNPLSAVEILGFVMWRVRGAGRHDPAADVV